MLQTLRERLILVLLAVLPFHALLVTVGTMLIAGPNHAPLPVLALWKEALLGVILLVAFVEVVREWGRLRIEDGKLKITDINNDAIHRWKITDISIDAIDSLIIALFVLAIIASHLQSSIFNLQSLLGFKYDFLPLVAFVLLRRVRWSDDFLQKVVILFLIVGSIVAGYGIIGVFLPQEFFTWLGYSDLHSLYRPDAPLAAFQKIGGSGIRRMQSVMSGPNQLGMWLLIPLSGLLAAGARESVARLLCCSVALLLRLFLCSLVFAALFLSFSRSAWIAAAVMMGVALWQHLPPKRFTRCAVTGAVAAIVLLVGMATFAPDVLLRAASTRDHLARPIAAVKTIIAHPLGLGLGTAGPASNRVSDTCVHLERGADPSWAADRPDLCVFVESVQVQPIGRTCSCPLLPENWYLQIGVELGILGMVLYVLLVLCLLQKLYGLKIETASAKPACRTGWAMVVKNGTLKAESSIFNLQSSIFLVFLGISIAALFLHAWEDSAVAYTVWILMGFVQQKVCRSYR